MHFANQLILSISVRCLNKREDGTACRNVGTGRLVMKWAFCTPTLTVNGCTACRSRRCSTGDLDYNLCLLAPYDASWYKNLKNACAKGMVLCAGRSGFSWLLTLWFSMCEACAVFNVNWFDLRHWITWGTRTPVELSHITCQNVWPPNVVEWTAQSASSSGRPGLRSEPVDLLLWLMFSCFFFWPPEKFRDGTWN